MAKRFTATEKWQDAWFRALPPLAKLGWQYLCDNCDAAGVIELDRDLANFQVGDTVDWDALIDGAAGRIELLPTGRLWLTRFITFQYGELSETCTPHRAALKSIEKYNLPVKIPKGNKEGYLGTHKDKDKDKDTDKDRKGIAKGKPNRVESHEVPVPDGWNTGDVLAAIQSWLAYKAKRGEAYKDVSYLGRKIAEFSTPAEFIAAVNSSIGNNYAGVFPAKDKNGRQQPTRTTSGQRHPDDRK
jgi:hypothetical protein